MVVEGTVKGYFEYEYVCIPASPPFIFLDRGSAVMTQPSIA